MGNNKIKYCYFGNTSVKEGNLLYKIEAQLLIFDDLFKNASKDDEWKNDSDLQIRYLEMLKQHNLINTKDVKTGTKNARTKSAPLEDYGLVDRKNKKVTELGYKLINLLKNEKFKEYNNFLQIDLVSFFFLKATFGYVKKDGIKNTFLNYLKVFRAFDGKLTKEQFYLLPLLCNFEKIEDFIKELKYGNVFQYIFENNEDLRKKREKFLEDVKQNNFENPDYFISSKGMNAAYIVIELFNILKQIRDDKNPDIKSLEYLLKNKINGKTNHYKNLYLKYIFQPKDKKENNIQRLIEFVKYGDDYTFANNFFNLIHSSRMRNNLNDYYEQNKYYLHLTGIFHFGFDNIEVNEIMKIILTHSSYEKILEDISKSEIDVNSLDYLFEDKEIKYNLFKLGVSSTEDLKLYKQRKDEERLLELLKTKFTKEMIYEKILPLFKDRKDDTIHSLVTPNATIPTIFEYIIAITWYYIDNENIDIILKAGLSLDSDMLPKSHATGGSSDFEIDYTDHILMIEVTLTEKTNQRRAEMESVSRHLGNILLKIENEEKRKKSFGIFIATYLDKNVLNDFRLRKIGYWENELKYIKGMNILPLDTDDIVTILKSDKMYEELRYKFYELFDLPEDRGSLWYENYIKPFINSLISS